MCSNSGLSKTMLVSIFLLKVSAGVIFGLFTEHPAVADTWVYHRDALTEYHLLLSDPGRYLVNIFDSGYADKFGGVLQVNHSYWNDLKTNFTVKLISLLDIFSGGSYYVNVVLYNFLIFLGCMGLYRVFYYEYKQHRYLIAVTVFMLPSLLLFGSSIHKDGIIVAAIGWLLFAFYRALNFHGFTIRRMIAILTAFLLIFIIRNYVAVMLLPALFAMAVCIKSRYNKYLVFVATYSIFLFFFFTISKVLPPVNPPKLVVEKQAGFFGLERAHSFIETDTLQPTLKSFISILPQSVAHSLGRPFLSDYKLSLPLLAFAAELLFYQLTIILCLFFQKRRTVPNPLSLFSTLFGLSVLIIIGYTVPVIWAIVRYRSIYLPFLLLPVLLNTDWNLIWLKIKIKK